MSKKNADREKEEEKDLDEEDEDDEAEDEEDEDAHPATSAKAADVRKARARTRPAPSHDHDDDHDADEDDEVDAEDPYWWTPHAVLSALVLVGVLGFFGVFNKVLAPIAAHPATSTATAEKTTASSPPSHDKAAGDTANKQPPEQRQEFGAKHLLVQYKGSARAAPTITRTEEEAKARATEAMKKARSGTKFEDVVKEYSDEPGAAQRGGDLGKFRKGQMVPAFQEAVEKLKVGEISDLVKTQFGYHVIQRTQ